MAKESEDLSVNGPYSPVSLDKFLKSPMHTPSKEITCLIDGTGMGIAHDAPEVIYVTPEECATQATYYANVVFDGKRVPAYLFRYLSYMFNDEAKWYETDLDLVKDMNDGVITEETPIYQQVVGLIKYCDKNPEAQQVIGLIQLIAGSLNIARKENKGCTLYLDRPETALHPKRQSRCMSMLMKLKAEYGPSEPETKTDNGKEDSEEEE